MDTTAPDLRSLVIDMEAGESLELVVPHSLAGSTLSVTMIQKSGKRARFRVLAEKNVSVQRKASETFNRPG